MAVILADQSDVHRMRFVGRRQGTASPGLVFDITHGGGGSECHVDQIDMIILVKPKLFR
jgi:hypothetical protein